MNLPWIDLETTGLRQGDDAILEIGVMITTPDLRIVDTRNWVISLEGAHVRIGDIDPFVWKIHTENGLWAECLSDNARSLTTAADEAEAFMRQHDAIGAPAFGSGVHFDRGMLRSDMRTMSLDRAFHYRNIDVSSLRGFAERFAPAVYEKRPQDGEKKHRALDDCIHALHEFRYYVDAFGGVVPA